MQQHRVNIWVFKPRNIRERSWSKPSLCFILEKKYVYINIIIQTHSKAFPGSGNSTSSIPMQDCIQPQMFTALKCPPPPSRYKPLPMAEPDAHPEKIVAPKSPCRVSLCSTFIKTYCKAMFRGTWVMEGAQDKWPPAVVSVYLSNVCWGKVLGFLLPSSLSRTNNKNVLCLGQSFYYLTYSSCNKVC